MELIKHGIYCVRNDIFPSNTYLVTHRDNATCLIIDPGLEPLKTEEAITTLGLRPVGIVATHGHFDHIAGVSFFQDKYNIPYFLHENDRKVSLSANFYLKLVKINMTIKTPLPNELFSGEKEIRTISGFDLVIHLFPGHTDGSCVIEYGNCLFTGDIVYKNGLGFNKFPGERIELLKQTILRLFKTFDKSFTVLPGHGESELLGNIMDHNVELKKFLNL